jgi:protein TonB
LSFWFSPVGAPDVLIKQTSETAAICHQEMARVSRKAAQIPDSHRTHGGAKVLQAKRIRVVAPIYPQKALEQGSIGYVTVELVVDVKGEPTELRILEAYPPEVFDQAALEAVSHWRYEPFMLDGVPMPIPDCVVLSFDPEPE